VQSGQVVRSEPLLDTIEALAEWLVQAPLLWRARHTAAARYLLKGLPDEAEPLAQQALELGTRAGEPEASVYFKSQSMCIRWQRGTLGELAAQIDGRAPRPLTAQASMCLIFSEGGRETEAVHLLDDVASSGLDGLNRDPAYLACVAFLAIAAVRLGHTGSALLLYERMRPFADQLGFDGVTTVGALEHHLGGLAGVLARHDEAVDRLRRGSAIHQQIGAPFFEACGRYELARVLFTRGDLDAARVELHAADDLATHHGYDGVHRDVHALHRTIERV
jgi:hypothetical protein